MFYYRVEPTSSPGLAFKNDDDEDSSHLPSFGIPPRPDAGPSLQGSLLTPFGYSADDDVTSETRSPEPVGFAVIANAINNALIALGLANPTTFVTDTSTLTKRRGRCSKQPFYIQLHVFRVCSTFTSLQSTIV